MKRFAHRPPRARQHLVGLDDLHEDLRGERVRVLIGVVPRAQENRMEPVSTLESCGRPVKYAYSVNRVGMARNYHFAY